MAVLHSCGDKPEAGPKIMARRHAVAGSGIAALCLCLLHPASAQISPVIPVAGGTAATLPVPGTTAPLALPPLASTPAGQASALMPSLAARPALPAGQAMIDIDLQDTPTADALNLIAKFGNIGIIIGDDVTGSLHNVTLKDKTPEMALRMVTQAAHLFYQQLDGDTYIVSKTPIPAPPHPVDNLSTQFTDATPDDGSIQAQKNTSRDIPPLAQVTQATIEDDQIYDYLKIRNISPRIMLWWLDPTHNPEPLSVATSRVGIEGMLRRTIGVSVTDSGGITDSNGRPVGQFGQARWSNDVAYHSPEAYNPYQPAGTANMGNDNGGDDQYGNGNGGYNQFSQPYGGAYTDNNAQFNGGGGGGRGGGGRNGRNGRNGQNGRNGGNGGGAFQLPEGIDSIVAIDPQNALLVRGTPDAVATLRRLISILDQPLQQVEIESQFVQVTTTDAKQFGITFSSTQGPFSVSGSAPVTGGSLAIGFVRNNFNATLQSLESRNRAKVVNAPRVTAINNLTATLQSQLQFPIVLNNTVIVPGTTPATATAQNLIYITTTIGLSVTPTINNDGTVTVVLQPVVSAPIGTPVAGQAPAISQQTITTVANVRDGDTIALGGLRTKTIGNNQQRIPLLSDIPFLGRLFRSHDSSETEGELIIFLTARIIPRLPDLDTLPPGV